MPKRDVHVALPLTSYVRLKMAGFERNLNAAEVFGAFANMIAEGDTRAVAILDELALLKYRGKLRERLAAVPLSKVESDLLYDILESAPEP